MAKAKAKDRGGKEGDPLKMYTLVMSLLVVVMAILYFVIDGTRKDYEAANVQLKKDMRFIGDRRGPEDPPRTIPDYAWEVESLSYTFEQASGGGSGGLQRGIPKEMMKTVATKAGLNQTYATRERPIPSQTYETILQSFDYALPGGGPPEIWRLLTLVWNIESRGRYRVSELSWQVAEKAENPQPPFDKVKKPRIEVALRVPKSKGD